MRSILKQATSPRLLPHGVGAGQLPAPYIAAGREGRGEAKGRREQRPLTREELAEKVGSHRDHIGRLERDETESPRMSTIRKLAEALEVDPRELLADEG